MGLRTLLLGSLLLLSLLVSTSCALATNNRLRSRGVEARATVTTVETTSIAVDDDPVLMIGLRIEDETGHSSNAVARQVIPTAQIGGILPGRVVTVRHDPAKPGRAVVVGLGHAPNEGEAHRILEEAQAVRERLNGPGMGRPAEGVVMSVEELGITVNQVANVLELRVMVIPQASAVGPEPEPRAEWDTGFESSPGFEHDALNHADPVREPDSAYQVEPLELENFDTNASSQADPSTNPRWPSRESTVPYEAVVVAVIAKGREDRYGPGRRVQLLYDPADRSAVAIDASKTPSCFSADTGQVHCEDGESLDARPAIESTSLDDADVDELLKKATSMRRAGISLAILGGAGTIAGWSVYGVSFSTRRQAADFDLGDPEAMAEHERLTARAELQLRAAIGTIVSASLLTVTGMLLARAGSNRLKRARMSRGEIGFFSTPGGFALRF
jgi:hypothetical protein